MNEYLLRRQAYSEERLKQLREALASHPDISGIHKFCIYTAGSLGRGDASNNSDLDLFMFKLGSARDASNRVSVAQKSLAFTALIKTAQELSFPPFTDGGKYLEIHYLNDMIEALGDSDDDKNNYFTARILLLLESQCIFGTDVYRKLIETVVSDIYLRDFETHKDNFRPIFLLNDVSRWWKTVCLNYEARRTRADNILQPRAKPDKRYKLKYSRLLTCYSLIASLISMAPGEANKERITKLVSQNPWQRIKDVVDKKADADTLEIYNKLVAEYEEFLKHCNDNLEFYLKENKKSAFDQAAKFGELMFDLLDKIKHDKNSLRYLTI